MPAQAAAGRVVSRQAFGPGKSSSLPARNSCRELRLSVHAQVKKPEPPAAAGKGASAPAPALAKPKPPSAEALKQAQPPAAQAPVTAAAIQEAWTKAVEAQKKGETVEVKALGVTEAGVIVQMRPLKGFIPFAKLEAGRLKAAQASGGPSSLVGQSIKAKVVSADPGRKELLLSERRVAAAEALEKVRVGDVLSGVVAGVEDYGAFVAVKGMPDVTGLVYKNELSWERIMTVDEAVRKGQEVQAKVTFVEAATCKLQLSIKALTPDPLTRSMDDMDWHSPDAEVLQAEIGDLVEALRGSVGVEGVGVTRVANDVHHVAPELEVYLTRSDVEGTFTALARFGTSATEMVIRTTLSREQLKQLLQRTASKVAA